MKRTINRITLAGFVASLLLVVLAPGAWSGVPPGGHEQRGGCQDADVVVVGTGAPDLDVPAVQAAVDRGGQVCLKGHFSFDRPPTIPMAVIRSMATVLVSKAVAIFGAQDEDGEMTTIERGTIPFYVEALGAPVTIQGLRFVRPKRSAIQIYAVSGMVIAYCRIEGVEATGGDGVAVNTSGNSPTWDRPGRPENVSGTLLIVNNDMDIGAPAAANTLGIVIFAVGKSPDKEVDLYVSGNKIRNVTERAINIIKVGGRAHIVRNVITTGATAGSVSAVDPDVIHAVGSGSYLIAHNSIDCAWATGAGIHVQSPPRLREVIARAIVVDNEVTMSAPEGTVFGENSAGIIIRGNVVMNNRIRGRARAALAVVVQLTPEESPGIPGNNTFFLNDVEGFHSSLADVFVGPGVTNTLVVGRQRSVEDHGIGTIIVPLPRKGDDDEDRHDDGRDDRR